METFPAQEISTEPVPVQEPSQKSLRKLFNISSWIILFALLPITVLIFLSQDSIPGDLFYPVKRSLENVVLAAVSVNPATRAAFRTDLTETRFKEAQSLVVSKSNATGLFTFIDEVQSTQLEVTSLKNDTEREKLEEKLISKIEEYQTGLSTLQAKTEQNVITYQFQETPISTPPPAESNSAPAGESPTAALNQNQTPQNFLSPTPTFTPSPTPTVTSSPSSIQTSSLTSTPNSTITVVPTVVPTQVISPESMQVLEQKKIAQTLKETKEQLGKIKKDLEENRKENKENREKRNENEKKDSSDRNK
ncbi:MAG: DUF5667 domain-containing protein [Patescibacteria group bacterium]